MQNHILTIAAFCLSGNLVNHSKLWPVSRLPAVYADTKYKDVVQEIIAL